MRVKVAKNKCRCRCRCRCRYRRDKFPQFPVASNPLGANNRLYHCATTDGTDAWTRIKVSNTMNFELFKGRIPNESTDRRTLSPVRSTLLDDICWLRSQGSKDPFDVVAVQFIFAYGASTTVYINAWPIHFNIRQYYNKKLDGIHFQTS